jgi:hypothetical protein
VKLIPLIVAASLAFSGAAFAQTALTPQEKGLSAPVVALTAFIAQNADALNLDDAQRAAVKDWVSTKPAIRGAFEDETAALRADLRAAILANAPIDERQALADQIGANEAKLVMMRSNCVDHWRSVLSEAQFDQALGLAGLK